MDAVSQKTTFKHSDKDVGRWHECTVRIAPQCMGEYWSPTKLGRSAQIPKADTEEEINGQRMRQLIVP